MCIRDRRKVQRDRKNFAGFIGLIISKISPIYMAKSCLNAGWTQRMAVAEMQKAGIKEYPAKLACEDEMCIRDSLNFIVLCIMIDKEKF